MQEALARQSEIHFDVAAHLESVVLYINVYSGILKADEP